jgi:hypothetical protein
LPRINHTVRFLTACMVSPPYSVHDRPIFCTVVFRTAQTTTNVNCLLPRKVKFASANRNENVKSLVVIYHSTVRPGVALYAVRSICYTPVSQ